MARYYRDAKVLEIGKGTSEIQRILIAPAGSRRPSSRHAPRPITARRGVIATGCASGRLVRPVDTAFGRPIGRGPSPWPIASAAPPVLRRAPALLAALALVSALGQVASAEPGTRARGSRARARAARGPDRRPEAVLGRLSEEIAVAYGRWRSRTPGTSRSPRSSRTHVGSSGTRRRSTRRSRARSRSAPARPTSSGRAASSSSSWARARSRTCRRGWST